MWLKNIKREKRMSCMFMPINFFFMVTGKNATGGQEQHRLAASSSTFTRNWSRYSGPPAVGNGYEPRNTLTAEDKLVDSASSTLLRAKGEYYTLKSQTTFAKSHFFKFGQL